MLNAIDRFFTARSLRHICFLGLLLVFIIGVLDYATGTQISFSIFYLLPILMVSWYGHARAGYIACMISAAVWLGVDRFGGDDFDHFLIPYWNSLVRLGFFGSTAYLLAGLKLHLLREQSLASTDDLTGLHNGRVFRELTGRQVELSRRYGRPFALAYIDVDNFKQVNDQFGHSEGDKVLRMVGKTLQACVRRTDVAGRLGGDEFALTLPEADMTTAQTVLAKVRKQLQNEVKQARWPIDFSIGVVVFAKAPETFDQAIDAADQLMYTVKSSRKCDVVYQTIG